MITKWFNPVHIWSCAIFENEIILLWPIFGKKSYNDLKQNFLISNVINASNPLREELRS